MALTQRSSQHSKVPAYCAAFVQAFERGLCGDQLHLGLWDEPSPPQRQIGRREFEAAQERLSRRLIGELDLSSPCLILDVACGLGGVLRLIDNDRDDLALTGLNLDPRQIDLCRRRNWRPTNRMNWIVGDACGLPFADGSFDAILCVEAMFHFQSRAAFVSHAARVLKVGGRLVVSDILLTMPGRDFILDAAALHTALLADYAPWPDPWFRQEDMLALTKQYGLECVSWSDETVGTLPSYGMIAPVPFSATSVGSHTITSAQAMRAAQEGGVLRYICARFDKREPR